MIKKIWKIYVNATKSIYTKEDNTINYIELITIYVLIIIVSLFLVFYKKEKFIEDSKILAMLYLYSPD